MWSAGRGVMTAEGEILELSGEELELDYRTSCIPARGYTVLGAELSLTPGDPDAIRARMEELAAQAAGEAAPGVPQRRQHL